MRVAVLANLKQNAPPSHRKASDGWAGLDSSRTVEALVDVFRRSQDVPPHLDDILAAKPKAVWMQSGIRHEEAALSQERDLGDVVVVAQTLIPGIRDHLYAHYEGPGHTLSFAVSIR